MKFGNWYVLYCVTFKMTFFPTMLNPLHTSPKLCKSLIFHISSMYWEHLVGATSEIANRFCHSTTTLDQLFRSIGLREKLRENTASISVLPPTPFAFPSKLPAFLPNRLVASAHSTTPDGWTDRCGENDGRKKKNKKRERNGQPNPTERVEEGWSPLATAMLPVACRWKTRGKKNK